MQDRDHAGTHPYQGKDRDRVAVGDFDVRGRGTDDGCRVGTDFVYRDWRRSVQWNELYRLFEDLFEGSGDGRFGRIETHIKGSSL